jgi:hypothetical protein
VLNQHYAVRNAINRREDLGSSERGNQAGDCSRRECGSQESVAGSQRFRRCGAMLLTTDY